MSSVIGNTSVLVNTSAYAQQPSNKNCYFFKSVGGDFDSSDDRVRTTAFKTEPICTNLKLGPMID